MTMRLLKDAIYGFAIGDALGVPVEFMPRGSFKVTDMLEYGTHHQPKGTWSDDTSMMLATCDSIKCCGGINTKDMLECFRNWLFDGDYAIDGNVFDIGGTTMTALRTGIARDDINSNGNGSLMRILPLAFLPIHSAEIEQVSAITHGHALSMQICCEYVSIVKRLLNGMNIFEAKMFCNGRIPFIEELDEDEIKSTGYVIDTFEAVMWAVSTTDNFKDAVLKAVNLGDDTDTIGALTGALAGIIYGYDAIPSEWIEALRGKEIIESCLF